MEITWDQLTNKYWNGMPFPEIPSSQSKAWLKFPFDAEILLLWHICL